MKRIISCLALILFICSGISARTKIFDYAKKGGKNVKVSTVLNYKLMETYPSCTITVYKAGTLTLATIYSDMAGTPKANPFTASSDASYSFYIDLKRYDIKFSGLGILTPFTRSDLFVNDSNDNFDVTTFGAQCDSVTDDTTKIANADAAAFSVGSQITIPIGTCVVNTIVVHDVKFYPGGILKINFGQTLTIGQIEAPKNKQIFLGIGTLVLSSQTVQAAWFLGADIGAKVTAANAALGFNDGTIEVYGGGTLTRMYIGKLDSAKVAAGKAITTAKRELYLGPGDWQLFNSNGIVFNSHTRIIGAGRGLTRILECSACVSSFEQQFFMLIGEGQSVANGTTYESIEIRNLDLIGTRTDFGSASQAISLGNIHGAVIDNVGLFAVNAEGIGVGATSTLGTDPFSLGKYAENVFITNCFFDHVASQNIGAVNFQNLNIINNIFMNSGQTGGPSNAVIDIETNQTADRAFDTNIVGNIINLKLVESTSNAIAYQPSAGGNVAFGYVNITNNIINGTLLSSPSLTSNGIQVNSAKGGIIAHNYIERMSQAGMDINNAIDLMVDNNVVVDSGTGGPPSIRVTATSNSVFSNNKIRNPNVGVPAILEVGTNTRNLFQNNSGQTLQLSVGTTFSRYEGNFMVNYDANANNFIADNAASANNIFKDNITRPTQLILASATSKVMSHCYYNAIATITCFQGPYDLANIPVFANNAAALAGGLVIGNFYRTGVDPDPVFVVH